ncbi:hypothetical protein LAZ67_15000672 [Cordylochernes scorpioides]|uniref:Reverse transcriptase domain-containing protein n=1 Tax=Cordylochernes scorpioides TaxID=51811 RepID=A0ABY6LAU6_9ARAC|nr:hypothetical protein LAZ67_15000672 [Cordylochernes scorpioides]
MLQWPPILAKVQPHQRVQVTKRGSDTFGHMLEKSKVSRRPEGETNFHIFYHLLAGVEDSLRSVPSSSILNIRNRQHQTTLTRFRTGHLKPLKIENNNKIYPTCPKCSLAPAASEHILACISCTKQDLWERPLLIIKQLEEHELMEFVKELFLENTTEFCLFMTPIQKAKSDFHQSVPGSWCHDQRKLHPYTPFHEISMNSWNSSAFIDLSQAFDRVWKEKLILKLDELGIEGSMLSWISNFLSKRTIQVNFNIKSKTTCIYQGLPQGSILSPILFNIYLNDVHPFIKPPAKIALYTDDIIIWVSKNNLSDAEHSLNKAMKNLQKKLGPKPKTKTPHSFQPGSQNLLDIPINFKHRTSYPPHRTRNKLIRFPHLPDNPHNMKLSQNYLKLLASKSLRKIAPSSTSQFTLTVANLKLDCLAVELLSTKILEKISLSHPRHLSVYKSELSAINMALKDININSPSKIIIYSNSRAAIYTLQTFFSTNSSVTVQWLPAHIGIPGNELADSLAKAGALGLPEARKSTTQLDERDLLCSIKTQCLQEWKSNSAHDWNDEKEQNLDSPQFQPHPNRESVTSNFSFSGTTTLASYPEDCKKAQQYWSNILGAMKTMEFTDQEVRALLHILAAIYHLGVAGVSRSEFLGYPSSRYLFFYIFWPSNVLTLT